MGSAPEELKGMDTKAGFLSVVVPIQDRPCLGLHLQAGRRTVPAVLAVPLAPEGLRRRPGSSTTPAKVLHIASSVGSPLVSWGRVRRRLSACVEKHLSVWTPGSLPGHRTERNTRRAGKGHKKSGNCLAAPPAGALALDPPQAPPPGSPREPRQQPEEVRPPATRPPSRPAEPSPATPAKAARNITRSQASSSRSWSRRGLRSRCGATAYDPRPVVGRQRLPRLAPHGSTPSLAWGDSVSPNDLRLLAPGSASRPFSGRLPAPRGSLRVAGLVRSYPSPPWTTKATRAGPNCCSRREPALLGGVVAAAPPGKGGPRYPAVLRVGGDTRNCPKLPRLGGGGCSRSAAQTILLGFRGERPRGISRRTWGKQPWNNTAAAPRRASRPRIAIILIPHSHHAHPPIHQAAAFPPGSAAQGGVW